MKSLLHSLELKYKIKTSKEVQSLNDKIKSNEIQYETKKCICKGENDILIAKKDFFGIIQDSVICMECGLVRLNPRMKEFEYRAFYSSEEYRMCYSGPKYKQLLKKKYNANEGLHIFEEVNSIIKINSKIKVLEFGAGGGWNLIPFINAGAEVLGIDYGEELVKMGVENKIPLIQGGIEKVVDTYDIIILNHVLEHSLNPVKTLNDLKKHLNKNGILYLGVPNILKFSFAQLQNAHTYSFSLDTLKSLCKFVYLEPLAMGDAQKIHIFGIFKISKSNELFSPSSSEKVMKSILRFKRNQKIKFFFKKFKLDKVIAFIYRRVIS